MKAGTGRDTMSVKNNTQKKRKLNPALLNIIRTELTVLVNFAIVYIALNLSKFANLKKGLFVRIIIGILIFVLILNFVVFLSVRIRRKWTKILSTILLIIAMGGSGFSAYALTKVNTNVEKMTETTKVEDINANIIVFAKSSELIMNVEDLEGKNVGIIAGTHISELTKSKLEEMGIHVTYTEFSDYETLGTALVNEIVDAMVFGNNYQAVFANEDSLCDFADDLSVLTTFTDTTTVTNESGTNKDLTKEPFTVLLIGDSSGLSDTIMIVSVNPISMRATMTSIARDSYVPITCYGGGSSKINASHAVSVDCLIDTVENLTGVNIDYYFEVNFQGVVDVVDALGGIRVTNHTDFLGQTYTDKKGFHRVEMPMGDNVLYNGEQALAWVRERKNFPDGDFARQRHQQEFIRTVLHDVMETRDVNTFLNLLDAAGSNIKTNLSIDQITQFLTYVMKKTDRYYNQDSVADIFLITGWRITGYSAMKYDAGLDMDLYIYRLWNSAIQASKDLIDRNLGLVNFEPDHNVEWEVASLFEEPVITKDVYSEAKATDERKSDVDAKKQQSSDSGKKQNSGNSSEQSGQSEEQKPQETSEPAPAEPTAEPAAEPTPEPQQDPTPAPSTPVPSADPAPEQPAEGEGQ